MTNNNENGKLLDSLFRPLIFVLNVFQLNGDKSKKSKCKRLLFYCRFVFWTVLLSILIIVNGFKLYYWVCEYKIQGLSLDQVFDLASCMWFLEGTMSLCFVIYWQFRNKIATVNTLLTEACGQKGIYDERKYLRWLSISLIIQIVLYTSYVMAAVSGNLFNTAFRLKALKFDGIFFGRTDLNLIVLLAVTYCSIGWVTTTAIYVLSWRCVLSEIKYLNKTINFDEKFDKTSLKAYLNLHKKLTFIVEEVSHTFCGYYFFMMIIQLPLITLLCFNILVQTFDLMEWIIILGWIGTGSLKLIALSLSPADITDQMSSSADVVYQKMNAEDIQADLEFYQLSSWFTQKASNHQVGLRIGGFFIVTKPLMLTVVSLIITYLTLIYQSYVPPSNDNGSVNNGTRFDFKATL